MLWRYQWAGYSNRKWRWWRPYTYLWSNSGNTASIINLPAGTYTVTVTSGGGCTGTATVVVSTPAAISITMSSTPVSTLGGNDGTATAVVSGGTAPYIYQWNTVPAQTNATAVGLTAGNYLVNVTDASGCISQATVTVLSPNYSCNPATKPWRTEKIDTWNINPNGNATQAGTYLQNNFAAAFPGSLVVGGGCVGSKTLTLTSVTAVRNFLNGQSNAGSAVLPINFTNPTGVALNNKLAAQLVAMKLNLVFDLYDPNFAPLNTVWYGNALVQGLTGSMAVYNGQSVNTIFLDAQKKLGGCAGLTPTLTEFANVIEQLNLEYFGIVQNTSNAISIVCPLGNAKDIESSSMIIGMGVFPNPSDGIVNLSFEALESGTLEIAVYDLAGRAVFVKSEASFEGENMRTYNMQHLAKGAYILRARVSGFEQSFRVIMN
ncbi:MAG: T9SS type A sorting domain-containing protein [Bacteroidetes bacterium]|nr:T9SS type A sorting domain-containing protein [Bacteroidota bacterium]